MNNNEPNLVHNGWQPAMAYYYIIHKDTDRLWGPFKNLKGAAKVMMITSDDQDYINVKMAENHPGWGIKKVLLTIPNYG